MVLFADIYEDVTNIFFKKHCKWSVITWEKKNDILLLKYSGFSVSSTCLNLIMYDANMNIIVIHQIQCCTLSIVLFNHKYFTYNSNSISWFPKLI